MKYEKQYEVPEMVAFYLVGRVGGKAIMNETVPFIASSQLEYIISSCKN